MNQSLPNNAPVSLWPEPPPGYTLLMPGSPLKPGDVVFPKMGDSTSDWRVVTESVLRNVPNYESYAFARVLAPEGFQSVEGEGLVKSDWIWQLAYPFGGAWARVEAGWVDKRIVGGATSGNGHTWLFCRPVVERVSNPGLTRPIMYGETLRRGDELFIEKMQRWLAVEQINLPEEGTPIGKTWSVHFTTVEESKARRPVGQSFQTWYFDPASPDPKGIGTHESPFFSLEKAMETVTKLHARAKKPVHGVVADLGGKIHHAWDLPEPVEVSLRQEVKSEQAEEAQETPPPQVGGGGGTPPREAGLPLSKLKTLRTQLNAALKTVNELIGEAS